jgi:hypothetical protein
MRQVPSPVFGEETVVVAVEIFLIRFLVVICLFLYYRVGFLLRILTFRLEMKLIDDSLSHLNFLNFYE